MPRCSYHKPSAVKIQATDLTNTAEVAELCKAVEKNLGPIDIVVNNAGMVQVGRDEPSAPLKDTSDAD